MLACYANDFNVQRWAVGAFMELIAVFNCLSASMNSKPVPARVALEVARGHQGGCFWSLS